MPPMLRDIVVDTLEREPDILVVGQVARDDGLSSALNRTCADVVIVGSSAPESFEIPRELLIANPLVRVLIISRAGDAAVMYDVVPRRTPLGEVSPQALVEAIRACKAHAVW